MINKKNNGITLISLVVMIVILLMLAGVTISTLTGDNGIIVKSVEAKEDSEKMLKADLLLIAAGFVGIEDDIKEQFDLSVNQRQVVMTMPKSYATKEEKIFVAGDMHRGQSLVVWAIAEGNECAKEVDRYLMGYSYMNE